MALVAASQVYEENQEPLQISGYSLRNVNIKTALRIPEDDFGVEVVLSMELSDDATAQSPEWACFSVSSVARSSEEWNEHCTGLVKVEVAQHLGFSKIGTTVDSRTANARAWYKTFASIGLGYGPTFQGLSDIRVDPSMSRAVATVNMKTTSGTIFGGESTYPLHPASLDSIFQLGLIACYGGQIENARGAFVPIHMSQLYLKHGNFESHYSTATAHGELRGLRGAYAKLQLSNQAGDVVLDIDSLRCISYLNGKSSTEFQSTQFRSPFARLVWRPDIRMMNNEQCRQMFPPPQENVDQVHLFPVMNRFASLILVDIYENLINKRNGPEPSGNPGHFAAWVKRRVESSDTPEIVNARKMSSHDRLSLLEELYSQKDGIVEVKIAKRLHENMEAILREQKTAVEILVQDGLLTALYKTGLFMTSAYPQLFNIFESLGHANPNQRILELGAGTGGATRVAMRALVGANGIKQYKDYTFTDVSAGFLASARESLTEHLDVRFSVLDIEQDPLPQGYESSYDVVMASQTLHATTSIANTLENCRRLLKPGGKLVLVENTQNNDLVGIILGTLTGYWHGIPDGRTDSPFLRRDAWDVALRSSGFSGAELILSDYPEPHATTTVLVSTYVPSEGSVTQAPSLDPVSSKVQLLYGSSQAPALLYQISGELEHRSTRVEMASLEDVTSSISPNARVVVYLDELNLLLDADAEQLERFKYLISNSQSLLLLTSGGIAKGRNPDTSFIPGLLRTLSTENPGSRFISVDVDADARDFKTVNEHLVRCLVDLESDIQQRDLGESKDSEFVWQDGCMWVSRFVPDHGLAAHTETPESKVSRQSQLVTLDSQGPVRAAFEVPGILSSLYFRPYTELQEPLPHDWIVVKVAAVGLNWKDLSLSSGRFDADNLSSEYTGTITEAGPNVVDLAVGDRVYGMGRGHFGNYTRVPAAFARKLRPQDDSAEVATMPLVYMTAVYAFEHITRLRKGQKVLIQSATGGLGLAAIQLAQSKGAEVYASVGTPDKARFLAETMKVPASHIFSSRSLSDLSRAAATTTGGGFDVILSTSKGEMLYASLQALAPLGHLIDVGRTEVGDSKTIGLELFQKSANFSSFDLSLVLDRDPQLGSELMKTVDEHYRAGLIAPVHPFTASCVSKLDQTLLGFSKGTHVGKLVVTFQSDALVRMAPPAPRTSFDPAARYIVSGGLGGLGRSVVSWMCTRGARDLIVLSRKGVATDEARMLIDSLTARGVAIQAVACDVSKLDDVLRVVREVSSSDRLIKGVVHAAVSYQDISFDKISIQRWRASLAAKVLGTRNLHEATLGLPLDFFVMTTSLESVFALATQSAYTAANVFQDAFARYRRQLGLVASTASFGFVSDVGSLATDSTTVDMFARNRTQTLTEH
jgi:NADPH:quinone reductase-like Zn-dependent oxidoreductase/SAM-dependent methyltransferase